MLLYSIIIIKIFNLATFSDENKLAKFCLAIG